MTKTNPLPPPPVAEQRPHQLRAPRHHRRGPLSLAQGPELSDRRRRGRALLSARRERLFRGGDGAAPAADRDPVPGDARPDPGGRQLGPGPRRRLALLVGVPARRAISHLVSPPRRRRRRSRSIFDEPAEAAGKQYFRLGAMEVSPDGRYAAMLIDDDGSERFQLAHPRDRHRPRRRDGHRGRHRPAGLDRRQPRHRLHRGQRAIGAATAPGCTGSASRSRTTARSTRRPRMSPSRSASAAPRTAATS